MRCSPASSPSDARPAERSAHATPICHVPARHAENLDAPIIVATLETQKRRLIEGDGPTLLVVDEYQMLGDPDRGLNYELAIALAPPTTQLLLLSGSVANPHDLVKWLRRLGREAVVIKHDQRPVPLEEVHANNLNFHLPSE